MKARREELLTKALDAINKSAVICKTHGGDAEETAEYIEDLQSCVENYSNIDRSFSSFERALNRTEEFYKQSDLTQSISVEEKCEEFIQKLEKKAEKHSKEHPFMHKFTQILEDIDISRQSRIECVSEEDFVPPIDPISKMPFKNPVRNTVCNHLYDADSIKSLLTMKHNTKCPYIGCVSYGTVQLSNLVPDKELKRKIDRYNFNQIN